VLGLEGDVGGSQASPNQTLAAKSKNGPPVHNNTEATSKAKIGPKQEPEPVVPQPGNELDDKPDLKKGKSQPVAKTRQVVKAAPKSEDDQLGGFTDDEISSIMDQAISQKKEEKFKSMIDRGAKIAAE